MAEAAPRASVEAWPSSGHRRPPFQTYSPFRAVRSTAACGIFSERKRNAHRGTRTDKWAGGDGGARAGGVVFWGLVDGIAWLGVSITSTQNPQKISLKVAIFGPYAPISPGWVARSPTQRNCVAPVPNGGRGVANLCGRNPMRRARRIGPKPILGGPTPNYRTLHG